MEPNNNQNKKPLLQSGPILINPDRVVWANTEANLPRGTGVEIQFIGVENTTTFYNNDANAVAAILLAASEEVVGNV